MVVTDVGRRADRPDAVGARLQRHRDAVVEIACAVVEVWEDVAVDVDHRGAIFALYDGTLEP